MTDAIVHDKLSCREPEFLPQAMAIAGSMASYSAAELQKILKVNIKIARQTRERYLDMLSGCNTMSALFSYTGTAYRALNASDFSSRELHDINNRLIMGSFLYGLLRPLDRIHTYRLEGKVELEATDHQNLFDYWRPLITDRFIEMVKADDGVLVNLASLELQKILDWKKVTAELKVITPLFKVQYETKPVTVSLYAKMCRGAMTRWIIKDRVNHPEELKTFEYQGFLWRDDWTFVLDGCD